MSLRSYFTQTVKALTASFTRQANTTAYSAGQVVSDGATTHLMKFANAAREVGYNAGTGGYITKVRIDTDKKAWASQMRLYLYNKPETGVTIPADGASMVTYYADRAAALGYIDLPTTTNDDTGTNSTGAFAEYVLPAPFAYEVSSTTQPNQDDAIYGVLVDKTGQTPASGQNFTVTLTVHRT
jgi:hypothetical protein